MHIFINMARGKMEKGSRKKEGKRREKGERCRSGKRKKKTAPEQNQTRFDVQQVCVNFH